jgi:signal transduction histidine kinase
VAGDRPLIEQVLTQGRPVYLENLAVPLVRAGFLEDCYFTFSYIPVRDERDAVAGLFTIVHATTARVLGERRFRVVRELAAHRECAARHRRAASAEEVLASAPDDLSFALPYELTGDAPSLVFATGLARGEAGAPDNGAGWPIGRTEVLVEDLEERFGRLPGGPSGDPACRAQILPIAGDEGSVSHVLVVGLNPRNAFDQEAKSFLQLLARQVAASITSARALAEKEQRAARLAELDRQKTEFFSNVSHEFRTPLTLMLGPIEEAIESRRSLDVGELAAIHRNSLRLLKLVNNLLDFSRGRSRPGTRVLSRRQPRRADRRPRIGIPLRDRDRRSRVGDRLPAIRRSGVCRCRHVGEDRSQSGVERVQVHVRWDDLDLASLDDLRRGLDGG